MMYAQQQQQAMQAQYAQQQAYEEHLRQQQMLYAQQLAQSQQQPIQPQATGFGANNPFAAFASPSSSSPAPPTPQPTVQPQREPSPPIFQQQPQQQQPQPQQPQRTGGPRFRAGGDEKHGDLARMLAGGREDGLDTFGNVGNTRVPVWQQKTGQGQGQNGSMGGAVVPQMTGLAKPNPFNTSGGYKAPTQFNQPTGYGNGQQQQQQNVSASLMIILEFCSP